MGGEGKNERALRNMSEHSFREGTELAEAGRPLLDETIRRVFAAMMGGTQPVSTLPITQRKRSAVASEGGKTRDRTEEELSRQGLRDSAFGMQQLEDVDRSVAGMLSDVDVGELEHLTRLGETLGLQLGQLGLQGQQAGMGGQSQLLGIEQKREQAKLEIYTQLGQAGGQAVGSYFGGPAGGMAGGQAGGKAVQVGSTAFNTG